MDSARCTSKEGHADQHIHPHVALLLLGRRGFHDLVTDLTITISLNRNGTPDLSFLGDLRLVCWNATSADATVMLLGFPSLQCYQAGFGSEVRACGVLFGTMLVEPLQEVYPDS